MPAPTSPDDVVHYRLAPSVAARFLGASVVALAVVVFVATAVVALVGADFGIVLLVALLGLVGVLTFGWWLRAKAYVVRAAPQGYSVRLVRGAGVREARWADVAEAVTSSPRGVPCLVLRLKDGRTTTIPVTILAIDREEFVRRMQRHLGGSVRRLSPSDLG